MIKQLFNENLRGELTNLKKSEKNYKMMSNRIIAQLQLNLNCEDKDEQLQINSTVMPLIINSLIIDNNLNELMELQDEGADFNNVDQRGRTPMHIAAQGNKLDIVKFLIETVDLNLNAQDSIKNTALQYACRGKFTSLCQYLKEHGGIIKCNEDTLVNELILLASVGNLESIKLQH